MKKRNYRITFYVSVELEKKAREKAYALGLIKDGKGIVGSYITMLIMKDLKEKPNYNADNKDYGDRKRIKVLFPEELMDEVRARAKELGFIRNNAGNVSEYINYLLYMNLCSG